MIHFTAPLCPLPHRKFLLQIYLWSFPETLILNFHQNSCLLMQCVLNISGEYPILSASDPCWIGDDDVLMFNFVLLFCMEFNYSSWIWCCSVHPDNLIYEQFDLSQKCIAAAPVRLWHPIRVWRILLKFLMGGEHFVLGSGARLWVRGLLWFLHYYPALCSRIMCNVACDVSWRWLEVSQFRLYLVGLTLLVFSQGSTVLHVNCC